MITAQGVHQVIVMGDERPASKELLERKIESLDRDIDRWQPTNAWDAANQRPLRYMKKRRTELRKAIDRQEKKEKELKRQDEKRQKALCLWSAAPLH